METALITGASSGIGWELAKCFARRRINLVLVARRLDRLTKLKDELEKLHRISVDVLPVDLSEPDAPQKIFNWAKGQGLQITYLVNNAGIGYQGFYHKAPWEKLNTMLNLHILALSHLTHLFLPDMIERRKGRILNVASTAAFQPGPYMAVYFASKSYILSLSEALANELKGTGVTVTCLCPGKTKTEFGQAAGIVPSEMAKKNKGASAEDVAQYGFTKMLDGDPIAIPGLLNTVLIQLNRVLPRAIVTQFVRKLTDPDYSS